MNPKLTQDRAGLLRIWDHPNDDVEYVAGVDVAEGRKKDRTAADRRRQHNYSDSRPDYSAIIMLEVRTGLHVATWRGYVTPDEYASVCAALGYYYNTAMLVVELNGPGLAVVTRLSDTIKYPNMYRTRYFNALERDPFASQLGWQTTNQSRKILISEIHDALNNGNLFTRDRLLVAEMRTMEFDDQGVERARGSDKDDCAMALGMALMGRSTSLVDSGRPAPRSSGRAYDDLVWTKIKERMEQRDARRTTGSRVFLGRSGARLPDLDR